MLVADTYLIVDPAWPWSLPGLGWPALAGVAGVLILLSVWTYLGVPGVTRRRLLTIVGLRLGALLVACLLVLRPSLARQQDEIIIPSKLITLIDASESMNFTDGFNNWSRWENARRILSAPAVADALKNLSLQHKVEIAYFQGAEGITRYDPDGPAAGKRTDMGAWLHELLQNHGLEPNLRGLVIFGDGADNGSRYPTLKEAARWAGVCPIHTFGLGKTNTSLSHRDLALVDIYAPTEPVPVKTQFTVSGKISAPGFVGFRVQMSLEIEEHGKDGSKMVPLPGKDKAIKEYVNLTKEYDNEWSLTRDAPVTPGEYKITVKVDPIDGEVTAENNKISSYITVTKDGVSILWVEGHQRLESTFILRYALFKDRRFRVYPTLKLSEDAGKDDDFFNLDKQHYDVIVIGDISAKRMSGNNRTVFDKIRRKVEEGTGLMLMGGHDTFGNLDWQSPLASPIHSLLPVTANAPGQLAGQVRVQPTPAGLDHFLLRLADDPKANKNIWEEVFQPLDGMTPLGTVKPGATVLATDEAKEPVLVGTQAGKGRVLVFAGDTTYKAWRRTPEALPGFERFWKQAMLWLAHQEYTEANAWIKLDKRRLSASAGEPLDFSVGLRGKGGVELKNADFDIKVLGPRDAGSVAVKVEKDQRGRYFGTLEPGEYTIQVTAKGKDVDGKELEGKASARFLAYAQDLENLRPAADHDFLAKLAQTGGGRFAQADETKFLRFLDELVTQKKTLEKPRVDLWPDWRRNPSALPGQQPAVSDQLAALWSSAALPSLILFVSFLSLEWYLRRRWGLV